MSGYRRGPRTLVIEASARVASDGVVADRIRRPATWHEWQPEIGSARGPELLGRGDHVTGTARMLGFAVVGRADVVAADDHCLEQDVVVGIGMRVSYRVEPAPGGCKLVHTLTADLPGGVAGRVLSFFLVRRLRGMQRAVLENLAAEGLSAPSEVERPSADAGI